MMQFNYRKTALSVAIGIAVSTISISSFAKIVSTEDPENPGNWIAHISASVSSTQNIYTTLNGHLFSSGSYVIPTVFNSLTVNFEVTQSTFAAVKQDLTAIYVNGAPDGANQFALPDGVAINVTQGSYVLGTLMAVHDISAGTEENHFLLNLGNVDIQLFGTEDETHHEGDIYGYRGDGGSYSDIEIGNISILASNTLQEQTNGGGGIYGIHFEKSNANLNVKDIEITVTGGQDNKGIYGYHSAMNSSADSYVAVDSIVLRATNFEGSEGYLRAIEKQGNETLIVNKDVTIYGSEITEGRITAVMVRGGETFIKGDVNVFLHDVADANPRDDNLTAVWVARTGNVSIDGNVILSYYDDDGFTSTFDQNVVGVGIMKVDKNGGTTTFTDNSHISLGGDVVVQLIGNAASVGLSNHSLYGVVNAGTNSSIEFTNGGHSKLYFGTASEYLHPEHRETTEFTSYVLREDGAWEYRTFLGSFSNFDTVVVTEHSVLRLNQKQTPFLAGEDDLFNTTKIKSGETTVAFGHVLTFTDFLNGKTAEVRKGIVKDIISMGGVLYLPENTSLEIQQHGQAQVMVLQNEKGASVEVDGTLELTNATLAVTVQNTKGAVTESADAIGYNQGTIEGTGHLVFRKAEAFDSLTYGTYDYKGNATTTHIAGGEGNFINAGLIKVANIEIGTGFSLLNNGQLMANVLQIDETYSKLENSKTNLLALDEDQITNPQASLDNASNATLTVTGVLINDGNVTNAGLIRGESLQNNAYLLNRDSGAIEIGNYQSSQEGKLENAGRLSIGNGQNSGTLLGTSDTSRITVRQTDSGSPFINAGLIETPNLENYGSLSNTRSGIIEVANFENNSQSSVVHNEGKLVLNDGSNDGLIYGFDANSMLALELSNGSGTFVNTGSIEVANFKLGEDTHLQVRSGHIIVSNSADLSQNASINIGGAGSTATAYLNLAPGADGKGLLNTRINVGEGSRLELGPVSPTNWSYEHALHHAQQEGLQLQDSTAILVLKEKITTGTNGMIHVGSNPEESMMAFSLISEEPSNGLYFEPGSVLVVNVGALEQDNLDSVMVTANPGAGNSLVHVAPEAKILVYGEINDAYGRYNLMKGFNASGSLKVREFTPDQLYVIDSSGVRFDYKQDYEVLEDGSQYVYLRMAGHQDVEEVLPGLALTEIVNNAFDSCMANNGTEFSCGVLRDQQLTDGEKEKVFNSAANIAFAGGVMASAMNSLSTGFGSLYNHLTMDGDAFSNVGKLWPWQQRDNLWLDVTGNWSRSRKLEATGLRNVGYRDHTYGFILGYDHKMADFPVMMGMAFSYADGNLKSRGDVSRTTNKHQSYGVHFYGNYSPNEYFNLIGSLHWLHNNADLVQSIRAGGFSSASASVASNLLAIGLRAETTLQAGIVSIVPHIEPRYIYAKAQGFDTNVDGKKVWSNKMNGNSLFQIPVGVAFRTDFKTESGWNVRPNLDVQVVPQVGTTKQKTTVTDINRAKDILYGEYQGKFGAEMKLGVNVDKGPFTFGVKYGFGGGLKGRLDQAFMVEGRVRW